MEYENLLKKLRIKGKNALDYSMNGMGGENVNRITMDILYVSARVITVYD